MREVEREPRIFDVVELPETEKGAACPMYIGDRPRRCNNPVEHVFVYEATIDREDDRRKNCLCCAECKPAITADDGLRADGGHQERANQDVAVYECHCGASITIPERRWGGLRYMVGKFGYQNIDSFINANRACCDRPSYTSVHKPANIIPQDVD